MTKVSRNRIFIFWYLTFLIFSCGRSGRRDEVDQQLRNVIGTFVEERMDGNVVQLSFTWDSIKKKSVLELEMFNGDKYKTMCSCLGDEVRAEFRGKPFKLIILDDNTLLGQECIEGTFHRQ